MATWTLLTDLPVDTLEQCRGVLSIDRAHRKNTHPGRLTPWCGWQTLMALVRGYDLAPAP